MNAPGRDRGASAASERPSARLNGTGPSSEHAETRDRQLRRASILGGLVTLAVALLGALGYAPGLQALGSVRETYIPMAPSTAASFVIMAGLLLAMAWRPLSKASAGVAVVLAALVALFGGLEVVEHFVGVSLNFEDTLVPPAGYLGQIPIARMSPFTGALFFFAGLAAISLAPRSMRQDREQEILLEHSAGLFGAAVTLGAFVALLAYLAGSPLLYDRGATVPMALTTAVGFLALGFATVCGSGRRALPVAPLLGSSTRAYLLRAFVPLATITTLVGCLLVLETAVLAEANPALVAAFMAVAMAVIAGFAVLWVARNVARALDQSESAREAAVVAMRRVNDQLRASIDEMPVAYILWDNRFRVVEWNTSAERIFGYSKREVLGKPAVDYVVPQTVRPAVGAVVEKLLAGEAANYTQPGNNVQKDGTVISCLWYNTPLKDESGSTVAVLSMVVDVTERERAELTLRESEERFRNLVEHAADPLFLIRPDGRKIIEVNQQACDAFRYERDELLSLALADIDASFPFDEQFEGFVQSIEPGRPTTIKSVGKRKDGSTFPIEVRIGVLQLRGKPHLLAMVRDMTERERAEEEQAELQERYRQGQKMEAIGQLAGGIAHDFNNLLTVINSYADCAAEDLHDEDPLKSDMKQIAEAGHRAAMLTRQLLAFSRKQVLEPKILDLNEVVTDLESMLKRLVDEDIEFSTVLAENLDQIAADPSQIDQVLMNLAVNARDAMPAGGQLTIETANVQVDDAYASRHPELSCGPYVMLAVTDSGTGISAAARKRIFEPFFTTKDDEGTGLGLSTVYGIVKQSGGSIVVTSEPGQGASFKVFLPRVEPGSTERTPAAKPRQHRGTETLLLVEDEPLVRDLAKRILTSADYTVLAAANGGEALLECEQRGLDVDLVLTDVVMPRMNGNELVKRLSPLCRPDLKVLYMSGYTGDAIAQRGVLDEGGGFISKPFKAQALLARVRTALDAD